MSELMVTGADGAVHPFLRGILTRSLQATGLSFDDAYAVADQVRNTLASEGTVTSTVLRNTAIQCLETGFGQECVDAYRMVLERRGRIRFRRRDNELDWFSRRLHQKRLERCGLSIDTASELAQAIYQEFVSNKIYEVRSGEIDRVTLDLLREELGEEFAERYRSWSRFERDDGILVLLCGGAPGVGKSTLAAEIATRLDIVRTQSTDMLREIMREMVPAALVPELHGSSFDVNRSVDSKDIGDLDEGNIFHGFRRQAELVQLASRAVLARAQRESVSVLVEGVHIWPGLLRKQVTLSGKDLIVEFILTVADQKQLVRRFRQRGREAPGRRGKRYLDHIDTIWAQQSMLIQEAKNQAIPIIQNKDQEAATVEIMGLVSSAIVAHGQGR